MASGHLGKSCNFLFRASVFLSDGASRSEYRRPVLGAVVVQRDLDFLRLDGDAFAKSPAISVDFAKTE
jgi:mannose-1-phosphate guanylyltransferase